MRPFISEETGLPLTPEDFGVQTGRVDLPHFEIPIPTFLKPEQKEMISDSTKNIGTMVNSVSVGNFIFAMLTSGSMQQLWGLIRAVQLMVLTALMEITFPANAAEFYKRAILFATMDVLSGEKLYSKIFEFRDTLQLSAKFEEMDFGDLNFIMNSGSFFILFLLILVEPIAAYSIEKAAVFFARRKCARKIGMRFHRNDPVGGAKEGALRLFMESYFEICMCAALSLTTFISAGTYEAIKDYFILSFDDALSSWMTVIGIVAIFVFPLWALYQISKTFKDKRRKYDPHHALLFEEFDLSEKSKSMYQVFFMLRRLALVAILVFMRHQVFFQCMLVSHLSLLNVVYLALNQPFNDGQANRTEIFNEFTVLVSSMIINSFLNAGIDLEFREYSGWLLVGVACLNIGVNILLLGVQTVFESLTNARASFSEWHWERNTLRRFSNWNYFSAYYPGVLMGAIRSNQS